MHKIVFALFAAFLTLAPAAARDVSFGLDYSPLEDGQEVSMDAGIGWTDAYSSSFSLSYSDSTARVFEIPGFGKSFQSTRNRRINADFVPFAVRFPFESFEFGLAPAANLLWISEETDAIIKDDAGLLIWPAGFYFHYKNSRTATLLSPGIQVSLMWTPADRLSFSYKGTLSPLYHLDLQQTTEYDFLGAAVSNHVDRWSAPLLEQRADVTVAGVIRGVFAHSYQKLDFQTFDWSADGSTLAPNDDIQTITRTRLGLELLVPLTGSMSKVKGGVYYDTYKNESSYWHTINDSNAVVCAIGLE